MQIFQHSDGHGPPLRVGIVVDESGTRIVAEILKGLIASNYVAIELALVVDDAPNAPPLIDVWSTRRNIVGSLFEFIELRRESRQPPSVDPALPTDVQASLQQLGVSCIAVSRDQAGELQPVPGMKEQIEKLDVLIWCARQRPWNAAFFSARRGCWFLAAGRYSGDSGLRSRACEVPIGCTDSEILLLALDSPTGIPVTLRSAVLRRWATLYRANSTPELTWEGEHFFLSALHELHTRDWASLCARALARAVPPLPLPELSSVAVAGRYASGIIQKAARRLTPFGRQLYHWRLSIRPIDQVPLAARDHPVWEGGEVIPTPRGQFWADPFLVEHGDRTYLFFENYIYDEMRAAISVCELLSNGTLSNPIECLRTGYHLSYPHVFAHQGEYFMIPETAENGTVELYKAVEFPVKWKLEKVLFRGMAVDTTFLVHHDRCYFFTSMSNYGSQFPVQLLFNADSITSEWQLHPASPISTGVHAERGGGAILRVADRLVRPVQNGSRGYGHSLSFADIVELDPQHYAQTVRATLDPIWANRLAGTHTYAKSSRWEVIDGLWRERARDVV
ncbi:MAG: hypothetical protein ABI859_02440 [Pseudomonadota bacterium]